MIKKIQATFISITMAIIFIVFSTIFFGIYMFIENSNYKIASSNIENVLMIYSDTHANPQQPKNFPNSLILNLDKNTIDYDERAFSDETVNSIINYVEKYKNDESKINITTQSDGYFYRFTIIDNNKVFIAFNMTHSIELMHANMVKILFVLLGIFVLLFVLCWAISYAVFSPLKKSLKQQQQFISDASHELKTPIAVISANADVIKQSNDSVWIDNIKSQTKRLDNLVTDMLTLAKIDERTIKLNIEEFNLSDTAIETLLPFDAVAFEKNKNLILNISPNVKHKGDKSSFKKIINILTDNAIKHATSGGEIIIDLNNENNKISFSVYNTGCTIKDEDTNKIFERFYRGDNSRSRDSGGSGLGLAIAKSIASANKWKLTAKSKENEFMKITLQL